MAKDQFPYSYGRYGVIAKPIELKYPVIQNKGDAGAEALDCQVKEPCGGVAD